MIELVPMIDKEYDAFYRYVIDDYASGLVRAGSVPADVAVQVSQQQCQPVLSNRLVSPNQFFYLVREETLDAHVGYLWWGMVERYGTRTAMLYFIGIFEPYRRLGYGTQTLRLLEAQVKNAGLETIRLLVFGHNAHAWALYEKMGYTAITAMMGKKIDPV
ncbi:MAG: GNAT family N-acetyltransferase [Anaerolineae bacterium]|nr:GNAT family N-acetyltransferase [Anaerolineae bacterium]